MCVPLSMLCQQALIDTDIQKSLAQLNIHSLSPLIALGRMNVTRLDMVY